MLVPIACRFIPYDQWLITHLDDGWKVRQLKHWILSKCNLLRSSRTRRSVSPITFAPSLRSKPSLDSLDDGYSEDDELSDQDGPPRTAIYPPRSQSSPSSSPLVDRYTLVSFSTGSILEDDFTFSFYNLRPYELVEMHPLGAIAPLQRDVLAEYVQPCFQAKVRVIVWNHRLGRFDAPRADDDKSARALDPPSPKSHPQKRKTKVNWKSRWVVVNQGVLSLCKEHVTNPALHRFALSAMTALRGTDTLERAFSIAAHPRAVCIQFRSRSASPPPSLPSSPVLETLKSNVHEPLLHVDWSDMKQVAEQEDRLRGDDGPGDFDRREGEWVILDMLDDHAFSSILRILHREAPQPISSSFVPSSSIAAVSPQSPIETSFSSYETIPYPEWRIHTVENARKAGMGDVGKPMAWILWTEKGLGESLMGNIRQHRQAFLQRMRYRTATIPSEIYGPDEESDEESEMEWEGWMRDLERQCRVRVGTEGTTSRHQSRMPSPPSCEASPPPLTVSHAPYPGHRSATEYVCTPERIKNTTVSMVSVGRAPAPRRRSSTVSTEGATRHDKGKDKERLASGGRAKARNTSTSSAGISRSPRLAGVRHVHSSSNLRISSPFRESDATDLASHPMPSSPSKPQSGFMRGVSLRAGKLVRGLESAIDFVDDRS